MSGEAPESRGGQRPTDPPASVHVPASIHVFISYASQDVAVADAVVDALERHGLKCWIAPRDVKAGALYADAIVRAISGAKAFVVVLSENAIASSHVGKEIERASSKKRPVIALRIDAAPLTPALEYFLSESQWVKAPAGHMEAAYSRLIDAIRDPEQTAPRIVPAVTPSADTVPAAHPTGRRNRILFATGVAAVAAAVAALLADKFWLTKHVLAETASSAPAAPVISDKSIAVLPFTDMSEKKDQEYFGDGMAEEILDLLAKIPGLTVIGRTSSFQFKGKNEDLRTIGTQLNAAYVLEGSVRKSGDQVRITAQLINTQTGTHEWSETYDRRIGDVLKLQDAIAAAVARELQLTVASGDLQSRSTLKSADAYDLMLRGRHAVDRLNKEGFDEADTLFQQALDRDATSADASAELAFTHLKQGTFGFVPPAVAFEQARRAAEAALKLDPKSARAHYVLGRIHVAYDWDWAAADREFQQTATLAPGSADAPNGEAWLSLALGRLDEALRQAKAALARDPLDPSSFVILSIIQGCRDHLPEAEAALRRVLDIRPAYAGGHSMVGFYLLAGGDRDAALVEMQQETSDAEKRQGLALVYYALGRKADANAALASMLKEQADGNAFGIAEVYAFRGQSDEAMHWLERAYTQKDSDLFQIKGDVHLKNLDPDPRYKALVRKMNLPE